MRLRCHIANLLAANRLSKSCPLPPGCRCRRPTA